MATRKKTYNTNYYVTSIEEGEILVCGSKLTPMEVVDKDLGTRDKDNYLIEEAKMKAVGKDSIKITMINEKRKVVVEYLLQTRNPIEEERGRIPLK